MAGWMAGWMAGKWNKYGIAEGLLKRIESRYFHNVALLIVLYFDGLQLE